GALRSKSTATTPIVASLTVIAKFSLFVRRPDHTATPAVGTQRFRSTHVGGTASGIGDSETALTKFSSYFMPKFALSVHCAVSIAQSRFRGARRAESIEKSLSARARLSQPGVFVSAAAGGTLSRHCFEAVSFWAFAICIIVSYTLSRPNSLAVW